MGLNQSADAALGGTHGGTLGGIRVDQLIDRSPLSLAQVAAIMLCSITTIADGFDAQAIGFLASPLADHFQIDVRTFAPAFAAGLFGIMIGALLMGPAGDRWGRKRILLLSLAVVGLGSLATVFVGTLDELSVLRFITGLGLGGAMPNTIALMAEYTPARLRPMAVCISAASIPTGGMLSGLVASKVLPVWGWQSMFVIGGAMPLLIAVVLAVFLPESLRFLSLDPANQGRIRAIAKRMWPAEIVGDVRLVFQHQPHAKVPVVELFRQSRAGVTLALWLAYFMNLSILYVVVSWLPAMLKTEGLPQSTQIMAITTFSFGGIVGSLLQAPLMARIRPHVLMVAEFAIFIALIEYLAHSEITTASVAVVGFAIGVVIQGAQAGLNVFAATFYPTSARSTGIGWGLGIGRIGSICGPLIGGAALTAGWSAKQILTVGAVPAVISAGAVLFAYTYAMARASRGAALGAAAAAGAGFEDGSTAGTIP